MEKLSGRQNQTRINVRILLQVPGKRGEYPVPKKVAKRI
jgi:hypothetical protein